MKSYLLKTVFFVVCVVSLAVALAACSSETEKPYQINRNAVLTNCDLVNFRAENPYRGFPHYYVIIKHDGKDQEFETRINVYDALKDLSVTGKAMDSPVKVDIITSVPNQWILEAAISKAK